MTETIIGGVAFIPYDDKIGVVLTDAEHATVWDWHEVRAVVAYLQGWLTEGANA